MSHRNGAAKLKLSNFGNFTIHSSENESENNKQKEAAGTMGNSGSAPLKLRQDAGKPAKRAPLGECHQINTSENASQEGLGQCHRLHQIPTKKRAEQFQIFLEEENIIKEEEAEKGGFGPCKDMEKEANGRKIGESPGKENIAPPIEPELLEKVNETAAADSPYGGNFEWSEGSSDGDTTDSCTPSEYLTAKSSVATFLSTKTTAPEKNTMYICYDKDIYSWMLHRERLHRPRVGYMAKQSEINEEMRKVLIDWFVDVAGEFELSRASFFLAVSLTDRALSKIDCPRDKLQLLGVTAIFIATKIQEIFAPLIKDITHITDDSYTEDQVRRMEKVILKVVDFQLNIPLVDSFAEFFDHFAPTPLCPMARHLMWYLLELSTLDFRCNRFLPSQLGAAAFLLASHFQQKLQRGGEEGGKEGAEAKIWSNEMVERLRVTRKELAEPASTLIQLHQHFSTLKSQSVRKKYANSKRCRVAGVKMAEFDELASQFSDG